MGYKLSGCEQTCHSKAAIALPSSDFCWHLKCGVKTAGSETWLPQVARPWESRGLGTPTPPAWEAPPTQHRPAG